MAEPQALPHELLKVLEALYISWSIDKPSGRFNHPLVQVQSITSCFATCTALLMLKTRDVVERTLSLSPMESRCSHQHSGIGHYYYYYFPFQQP
ncbi:hypothetical protein RGQ29_000684 [Quercus rubra]|uniref:Uncharacterized protein n=1 Tax=Quercus rubra TaxID=3512 RepID=A0AAN7G551_QUERU|nr:hypothetical protein RGQ29_000684 [Quercus rubra]